LRVLERPGRSNEEEDEQRTTKKDPHLEEFDSGYR